MNLGLWDPVVVLEDTSQPNVSCQLILSHAQGLSFQVLRLPNICVVACEDRRVPEGS